MSPSSDQLPQNITQIPTQSKSTDDDTIQPPTIPDLDTIGPPTNPDNDGISQHSNDNLRKQIFKEAMSNQWKLVFDLYKDNKPIRNTKITRANETVLHVALSGASEYMVLKFLEETKNSTREECKSILGSENKDGDTPLHLAAALGLEKVCRKMANMCPELVTTARNNLNETPLFTAVRHGKKDAFFVLEAAIHKLQNLQNDPDSLSTRDTTHCRRNDGNNILHYAIKGEQFDLAYEIINLYPLLVTFMNSSGESALHVLANKPSVFKSGTRFGLYDTIIFYCSITEPLVLKFNDFKEKKNEQHITKLEILKDENEFPSTYKTCIDVCSFITVLIKNTCNVVGSSLRNGICKACCTDVENPNTENKPPEVQGDATKATKLFPPNYDVAIFFFRLIIKLLLVVLGIGLRRVQTIEKKKQKHWHACKIMNELVERSEHIWAYDGTSGGMNPYEDASGGMNPFEDASGGMKQSEDELKVAQSNPALEEQQLSARKDNMMIATKAEGREMLKKVLENFSLEAKNIDQKEVLVIGMDKKELSHGPHTASPLLVAAKRGITEMVVKILKQYPVALWDHDDDDKNIVLLAVEHRQAHIYEHMQKVGTIGANIFGKLDKQGNSALHLAARLSQSRPWSIPGAALQMQWEIKWYKYVFNSMDQEMTDITNNEGKRAQEVFTESHETMVKDGSTWLTNTSQSCSVVAALVATVAFASASQVPGGVDQSSGLPVLSTKPAFQAFAIGSLVALCFSVTSLVMFLAILTSRYQEKDFERGLPVKLILGLTSLFMSIAAMLVSFCAGDFFIVGEKLKFAAYPIYVVMCFPVTFFAIAQFKLYVDLIQATIKKVPERTGKMEAF